MGAERVVVVVVDNVSSIFENGLWCGRKELSEKPQKFLPYLLTHQSLIYKAKVHRHLNRPTFKLEANRKDAARIDDISTAQFKNVTMSQSPKAKAKLLREPPPSLFLGPPSQNASHVSLPGTLQPVPTSNPSSLNPSRAPLIRQRSQRMQGRSNLDGQPDAVVGSSLPRPTLPRQQQESEGKKQADRTDALWAEMQSTLEEVELSAVNGTHVFGPEHSKALEELRAAQIGLAQAWARSEADEAVESADKESKGKGVGGGLLGSEGRSVLETLGTDGGRGSTISGSGRPGSSGVGAERTGTELEEETESDILLARKRREANDKYFQRVNGGVLDVVAKLEEVAAAMRAVEQESKDIWGENESAATSIHG